MKRLLYLKSWQVFLLMVIPLGIQSNILFFEIINLFGFVIYVAWIYSIGNIMHSLIPGSSKKPELINLKISSLTMLTSMFLIDGLNIFGYYNTYLSGAFGIILLVSVFYSIGFAARMLESKISGRIVNRSDSLKAFIFILFFFVGVWFLQPLFKKILAEKELSHQ